MVKVHLRVVIAFYQKRIVTDFARFGARQLFYSCFRQHIPKHEILSYDDGLLHLQIIEMSLFPPLPSMIKTSVTRQYACHIAGELYHRYNLSQKKLRNIYLSMENR